MSGLVGNPEDQFSQVAAHIIAANSMPSCHVCMSFPINIFGCKNLKFCSIFFIFFLFLLQNTDCGYMLEPPWQGGSNEYPQSMFWVKKKKKIGIPLHPQFCYIQVGYKGVYPGS